MVLPRTVQCRDSSVQPQSSLVMVKVYGEKTSTCEKITDSGNLQVPPHLWLHHILPLVLLALTLLSLMS